jgi:hypothetical protein
VYEQQPILAKDQLGRPFVGWARVRFIEMLEDSGATGLAVVELLAVPCLFDASGRPTDLSADKSLDWPIGLKGAKPVLL